MNISRIMAYGVYTTSRPKEVSNQVRSLMPLTRIVRQDSPDDFCIQIRGMFSLYFDDQNLTGAISCNSVVSLEEFDNYSTPWRSL